MPFLKTWKILKAFKSADYSNNSLCVVLQCQEYLSNKYKKNIVKLKSVLKICCSV